MRHLMSRHFLPILIGLLWTGNLLGQVRDNVKDALSKKDFISFINFIDTLSNSEQEVSYRWTVLRDITADFREGVIYFTKSFADSKNPAIKSFSTFKVRLLTFDKAIIYYDFGENRSRKINKDQTPSFDTLDYYKNDSLFAVLRQSFIMTFDGELNETELFIDDLVYGQSCGLIGEDPKEKIIIDNLVAAKNKEELFTWLKSTNFERQVYALDGLYQLKASGTTYTIEEHKIIKNVLDKKGTIFHCRGCVHSWTDVKMVTWKFKFD